MIIQSNIKSLEDIKNMQIRSMRRHPDWQLDEDTEYFFQCDACEQYKREENMYSHDWCKNCYKHFLKCKFQGRPYIPWIRRKDLHDKYGK